MTFYEYPFTRPRRLRINSSMRHLTREVTLCADDLIQPFFIIEGKGISQPIPSMKGVYRYSIDLLLEQVKQAYDLGIKCIALFPVTPNNIKCEHGKEALNPDNLICSAISEIKKHIPEILICSDVALDPYTTHGHDGILDKNGYMDNDETLEILSKQALIQSKAGADIIAPSDMCDGRVGIIRKTLENNNFKNISILSYAVKYASSLYGPFRDAVGSDDALKSDKKQYQMDFHNYSEAFKEVDLDISEGVDMIMIKPGMLYLDIISRLSENINIPIFAYQVSGEYSMISSYAGNDAELRKKIIYESLIAFKRSGCRGIFSYFAMEYLKN